MDGPTKIMIIRHGEKPMDKHVPPYGVTPDGEHDWESLTVQGWLRAGAVQFLFAPLSGKFVSPNLATPSAIFASKRREAKTMTTAARASGPCKP